MIQKISLIDYTGIKKIHEFPDGEVAVEIEPLNRRYPVGIDCRIRSPYELVQMMQLSDILKRQSVQIEYINIYYLMGMRNDRVMSFEKPYGLKVTADVINSFKAKTVFIYEAHSNVAFDLIERSFPLEGKDVFNMCPHEYVPCYPDEGAFKRYWIKYGNGIKCSKVRDEEGNLIEFKVNNPCDILNVDTLVLIDDLCDGGGTFKGLAPKLREVKPKKLVLAISHAIQGNALIELAGLYDEVITTNSYNNWDAAGTLWPENIKVVNLF